MRCTAIISAYKCADWLEGRITNLLEQSEVPEIQAVAQLGSKELDILIHFNINTAITEDIPTVYWAWNRAIKKATTPYINIANSDDRLSKFAIEEMCDELDKNPEIGLVYPDCNVITEANGDIVSVYEWAESSLMEGCHIGPCPTYRAILHNMYGYFPEDYIVAGDYWYWLNLEHNGVKFKHIKKPLATFWDRSKNPSIESNLEFRMRNRTVWETAKAQEYWRNHAD